MFHKGGFNNNCISTLLYKLSKESFKQIFLLGNLNIDLLKYQQSEIVNTIVFKFSITSNNFSCQRFFLVYSNNNVFCNLTHTAKSISGKLTSIVSVHLPQFQTLPEFFSNTTSSKYNIYTHD